MAFCFTCFICSVGENLWVFFLTISHLLLQFHTFFKRNCLIQIFAEFSHGFLWKVKANIIELREFCQQISRQQLVISVYITLAILECTPSLTVYKCILVYWTFTYKGLATVTFYVTPWPAINLDHFYTMIIEAMPGSPSRWTCPVCKVDDTARGWPEEITPTPAGSYPVVVICMTKKIVLLNMQMTWF